MRTKQRYRCKACGLNFTDTPPRGKPLALKVAAVLEGLRLAEMTYLSEGRSLRRLVMELCCKRCGSEEHVKRSHGRDW